VAGARNSHFEHQATLPLGKIFKWKDRGRPLVPLGRPMVKIADNDLKILIYSGGYSMPRGRQKDRDLRRKHRKNQQRIKGLETARREKGKKK
jgi:hypothetical protein